MTASIEGKRARLMAGGFLARVASPQFKAGKLSRTLAGAGRGALTEALYGIILDIPEAQTLVELAVEDLRKLRAEPPRPHKEFHRAIELEALEMGEWLLSGSAQPELLREALRLHNEAAQAALPKLGLPSSVAVDVFMPVAWLAGERQQALDFYRWSRRGVRGTRTPRGVARVLCESPDSSAGPIVETLVRRFMSHWFERGGIAEGVVWLRILNHLSDTPKDPRSVVRGALQYLDTAAGPTEVGDA